MTFLSLIQTDKRKKMYARRADFFLNVRLYRIILISLTFKKTSRDGKFDIANSRISNFTVISLIHGLGRNCLFSARGNFSRSVLF